MTPIPPLPSDAATLQQMVRELLGTIAELRAINAKQSERIDYLTRMHFGSRSERIEGPTLFDDFIPPEPLPEPEPEPVEEEDRKSVV